MENQMKDNAGSPSVESLIKRGYLFMEDSEWNKADEYFDKALDINPEYAPAYIGKLCVELMVHREESLGNYNELRQGKKFDKLLGEYGNFQKALRFADEDYKKKLNGYDQKIKENFPKTIPQRFTDEFVKGEIARLEKEIENCTAEITKGEEREKDLKYTRSDVINQNNKIINDLRSVFTFNDGYDSKAIYEMAEKRGDYLSNKEEINTLLEYLNNARQRVEEYINKKAKYESEKQEIDQLAGISCLDRMDVYYNRVVEDMQKASTEDEFKSLAEQFRSLEGYKDSAELADKCGKLVIKAKYDKLVQEKNKAATVGYKTEQKYRELSKQFRDMGGYENTAKLADECDKLADECVKQKEREKKARYDALVQEKSNASTEDKYRQLTQDFRGMGNYENAVQLANECDKQMNILKKQREEQERQEKAKEQQEKARVEEDRKKAESEAKRKEKLKKLAPLIIIAIVVLSSLIKPVISLVNYSRSLVSSFKFSQLDTQGTITVTGYSGKKQVVIPAKKGSARVTEIGYEAFNAKELVSVTIPEGVTSIGGGAFSYNKLESVTIPASVTSISNDAFLDNRLESVTIPASVDFIGEGAFRNNYLTSVTIPASVTSIGKGAFSYNKLESVTILASVDFIGEGAFRNNNLTSVTIPASVIIIAEFAFGYNNLTSVTIPNSVTSIGENAFNNNKLTSVTIPDSVTSIGNGAFAYNPVTSIRLGANVKLGGNNDNGVLGYGNGFNGAYNKNGKRAGTYTRPDQNSTIWTRR